MGLLLKKIMRRLRIKFFPSPYEIEVNRWCADDNNEKSRYDYDLDENSLVVDLGGYRGQWASDIYARYSCRVMVVEPVRAFADKIAERFKKNIRVQVFCLALGREKRQDTISINEDSSSVCRSGTHTETIQFEDAAKFFKEHGVQKIDLMKINIEGGEYELLSRLIEVGFIPRIRDIQVQFHNVSSDSESKMLEIQKKLAKTHRPTFQYKFVWENWERKGCSV